MSDERQNEYHNDSNGIVQVTLWRKFVHGAVREKNWVSAALAKWLSSMPVSLR
jgi:hypothetical protein